MNRPRSLLSATVLLALTLSLVSAGGSADAGRPGRDGAGITGNDGLTYDRAPLTVPGLNGELFLGPDFDIACAVGDRYDRPMRTYAKVAKIIERSGRRVVFTAAPNKSAVLPQDLERAQLPHGECDTVGLAAQNEVIDHFADPNYLPLRKPLMRSEHQTFWRTDPHWTTVGGSVFARELATKLDPKLGQRQRYTYGTSSGIGMLNDDLGIHVAETYETAAPRTHVVSRRAKGSVEWAGYPQLVYDYSWNSAPAKRTWPGKTLLLGDSFMMFALGNMLPLFRHGRFMWVGHADQDVAQAVKESDTVVIEVVQLFVPGTIIATDSLRKALRKALR